MGSSRLVVAELATAAAVLAMAVAVLATTAAVLATGAERTTLLALQLVFVQAETTAGEQPSRNLMQLPVETAETLPGHGPLPAATAETFPEPRSPHVASAAQQPVGHGHLHGTLH